MFCSKCGAEIPNDAYYCCKCGSATVNTSTYYQAVVPAQQTIVYEKTVKKKRSLALPITFLLIVVAAFAFIYLYVFPYATPEKTIAKFESSYNECDFRGMYKCCDSKTHTAFSAANNIFGGIVGFGIGDILDLFPALGKLMGDFAEMPRIKIKINKTDYTDDKNCIVNVTITLSCYGKDESETGEMKMVRERGRWLISDDNFFSSIIE